ncbi:hypothetical protein L0664_05655 [Octadecabacter sp. G9-8]|uniref:Yip1 domain-containing protein n=1 Tax=Octadecabacter dasysiphoniae TaxID=2909341 RepID=A0ABS9CTI8_9RHOB|nr:YIP1 family protein [Octadecabacter dasysiphoniae]MCF2870546.1 hypothetical protein [Octadecabacter dasysiphoniae]
MDLTVGSLWEWTKLFVRDPRTAAQMVKAAKLPLEVSILMIVVAGVVSTVVSGIYDILIGSPDIIFPLSETEVIVFERTGPITQGIFAVITGVGLGYSISQVGRRMGGTGSVAEIMSITAVLQLVLTVIVVGQFLFGLTLPLVGFVLMMLGVYVFIRGLGHAVNVGHDFDNMGKSAWVTFVSFMALVAVVFAASAVFGVGPNGQIVPMPLGETL